MATLTTIPPEVRLMILEHLLVSQKISSETRFPEVIPYMYPESYTAEETSKQGRESGLHPQILRTCRKFYNEGIELLYARNSFSLYEPAERKAYRDVLEPAKKFCHAIGETNSSLLRRIMVGGGTGLISTDSLRKCLQLASGLVELKLLSVGPRCQAPYSYMLQYYLNIQAAMKSSSTRLTELSSDIPNGFAPEGVSLIYLVFRSEKKKKERSVMEDFEVNLDESIALFREKVREQEREWQKKGWNLPVMYESADGLVAFV